MAHTYTDIEKDKAQIHVKALRNIMIFAYNDHQLSDLKHCIDALEHIHCSSED